MSLNPTEPLYPPGATEPRSIIRLAIGVSIVAFLVTIGVVIHAARHDETFWLYTMIGVWAVGPPLWFWFEYFLVYRAYGRPDTLELFKYGQEVAKAIWAGVLAALIAFAASDAVKKPGTSSANPDATSSARPGVAMARPPAREGLRFVMPDWLPAESRHACHSPRSVHRTDTIA